MPHKLIQYKYNRSSYRNCPRLSKPLVQFKNVRSGGYPSDMCSGNPYVLGTLCPREPYPCKYRYLNTEQTISELLNDELA